MITHKVCPKCQEDKDIGQFPRNRSKKSGRGSWCRLCSKQSQLSWKARNPEKAKEADRLRAKKYYDKNKVYVLCRKYGISTDYFYQLLDNQSGKCAICREDFKQYPCIDHCSDSNKVRGILCRRCNLGIGQMDHSVTILQNAISYLS